MLRFKEFLKEMYLVEASFKHFSHLGLDPENPEHKDLIDAYNAGHSKNDPDVPRQPNKIKTIDDLKNMVKPHLEKIAQKRRDDDDDRRAWENGEAKVIHHNPETGVTVTQYHSQRGAVADKMPSTYCTGQRGHDAFNVYDPEGNHSFSIRLSKEKNKNDRITGAFGKYKENHYEDQASNFQDPENHVRTKADWDDKLKRYPELSKIKYLKGSLRGIGITDEEKNQYRNDLTKSIKDGTVKHEDVSHAIGNTYITDQQRKSLLASDKTSAPIIDRLAHSVKPDEYGHLVSHHNISDNALVGIAQKSDDPEIHRLIVNNKNAGDNALSTIAQKSDDPKVLKKIAKSDKAGDNALGELSNRDDIDNHIRNMTLNHKNAGDKTLSGFVNNSSNSNTQDKALSYALGKLPNRDDIDNHISNPDKFLNDSRSGDITLNKLAKTTTNPELLKKILLHKNVGHNTLTTIMSKGLLYDKNITKDAIEHKNNTEDSLAAMTTKLSYDDDGNTNKHLHLFHKILDHNNVGPNTIHHIIAHTRNNEIYNKILSKNVTSAHNLMDMARRSNDENIYNKILKHKNVSDMSMGPLATKVSPDTLLEHPKVGDSTLAAIAHTSEDKILHNKLFNHKNASTGTIDAIAQHSHDPDMHDRLIENPNISGFGLFDLAMNSENPMLHRKILNHASLHSYPRQNALDKFNDPMLHSLYLNKFGHQCDNGEIKSIAKKYKLNAPHIPSYESDYSSVSPENLEKVKHQLSKLAARTEASRNRQDNGNEKEPLVTPIKSRQKRYNFTEQVLSKIK